MDEALDDAGLEPNRMTRDELRGVGVIVGSGGGSQEFTEEQYRLYYTGHPKQCSVYTIPTSTIGTLASEISMRFGFRGLSHIVSTGCTSSTDAIGYAYRNIQAGVLDMMVAGGVDAPIAPLILRGFMLMRIMTSSWNAEPERASRPFSRDRDGFVLAEGAWFLVLEELEHARARGAHIYGEIAGYASTCEAYHRVRLEECGEEPARTMTMAMEEAGIAPEAIEYINYHGTSTELNDRIETRATKLAFNGHAYKLAGSSLKSLIGHPQGACGAAGIASTLLSMRDGSRLPPSTWTSPIRNAISITSRIPPARWISNMPCRTASPSAARIRRWCCGRSECGAQAADVKPQWTLGREPAIHRPASFVS